MEKNKTESKQIYIITLAEQEEGNNFWLDGNYHSSYSDIETAQTMCSILNISGLNAEVKPQILDEITPSNCFSIQAFIPAKENNIKTETSLIHTLGSYRKGFIRYEDQDGGPGMNLVWNFHTSDQEDAKSAILKIRDKIISDKKWGQELDPAYLIELENIITG